MQVEVNVQSNVDWLEDTQPTEFPATQHGASPLTVALSISPDTWQQWFQSWLESLNPNISPIQAYELTLRLTNDAEVRSLNATYRQQDRPTDVLAFAALEADIPYLQQKQDRY